MSRVFSAMQATGLGTILLLCLAAHASTPTLLWRDESLLHLVTSEAYGGTGTWENGEYWVAVGHSSEIDSLGETKGRRTERDLAEDNAKELILQRSAVAKVPDYDGDSYDLKGQIKGFQTAATYRIDGMDGLYLIGVAKKASVQVEAMFNPQKARLSAIALFDAKNYKDAAARLASLTQRGIQDPETMAYAHAASWHVNLDSGVKGNARETALRGLGQFHLDRQEYEESLKQFHALYLETDKPEMAFLEKLVFLCDKTGRHETANRFMDEINKRWPKSSPPIIQNATIDPAFEPVLNLQPILLQNGGARLLNMGGSQYFVAVGTTDIRQDSATEKLRRLRVGRVQAQKEAIAFLEKTKVVASEKFIEKTIVTTVDGKTSAEVLTTLDESTATRVSGILGSLSDIGMWTSPDNTIFFFAIGKKLN